jgi:hypothetical protein
MHLFNRCATSCPSHKEPIEQLSHCFHDWFIWRTFVLGYTWRMFAWKWWSRSHGSLYVTTRRTELYWLPTRKSLVYSSGINEPWERNRSQLESNRTPVIPYSCVHLQRLGGKRPSGQCWLTLSFPTTWQVSAIDKCSSHIPVVKRGFI